jgi:hypothetical protein
MFIDETHLLQGIRDECSTILCMTERSGVRIEEFHYCNMGKFSDTAAPVIERVFRLENIYELE